MSEETHDQTEQPTWYGMVQKAIEAPGELDWVMCCSTTGFGSDPMEVAKGMLLAHPDRNDIVHRAVLWTNPEHTGLVWRISQTSANRFNPNTGETIDLDPLPIPLEPQGKQVPELTKEQAKVITLWERSQNETAAGLRWATAADKARNQPYPQPLVTQGEDAAAAAFRAQFEARKEDIDPSENRGPQGIPHNYQPAVVKTARVLNEAIQAAAEYARTHHEGVEWTNIEECLSPVATASSAFVAAYMMWRLSE